uniref:Uncharacterized protein n=1 Tax=Nelumbo nucifera TaxID=4432 RepID=A0A822Z764_NELNU|nr:TPA_asm: hypothetical protein HUJ06_014726 [Nelumbo nucifera]
MIMLLKIEQPSLIEFAMQKLHVLDDQDILEEVFISHEFMIHTSSFRQCKIIIINLSYAHKLAVRAHCFGDHSVL